MANVRKPVDVAIVGVGLTGTILATELAAQGLTVVGLERGRMRRTVPDFQSPAMHDELKFAVRHGLMQNTARETVTFRNSADQEALPMRYLGSFLPGTDVGGAIIHWNGQTWRFLPSDFRARSHNMERYGADALQGLSVQDWGVTYEQLEPHYDRFDKVFGIGGTAGNLRGEIRPGGNPFEGPRANDYPNPPMKTALAGALFTKAAQSLGLHPFPVPSANMTRAYTNPYGQQMKPCMYCGYCERFGCEHYAKASSTIAILPKALDNPNFELLTESHVLRVNVDKQAKRARSVSFIDATGQEWEQPAELVLLCGWAYHNARLMLLSGIGTPYDPRSGKGTVGRNYCYQTMSSVTVFHDQDTNINPFMGAGALGMAIDDYNGDNFDHSGQGFIGGAYIAAYTTGGRPIQFHPTPPGTPRWGAAWKAAVAEHYNHTSSLTIHGASMAAPGNYVDLDPTYTDIYGQPLLRITFDFPQNDHKMSAYLTQRAQEIAGAMGGKQVVAHSLSNHYSIVPYQTTHNTGGAPMGADPTTSAVNPYLQSWDVPNVFVMGTTVFPQNAGYNPTGTVGALTYWALDALTSRYLKSPGPLVPA